VANDVGDVGLEELKEAKLGGALEHIAGHRWTEAEQERACALGLNHLSKGIKHARVAALVDLALEREKG
jgi:hypothetical protein